MILRAGLLSAAIFVMPLLAQAQTQSGLLQSETYFTPEMCEDILNPVEGRTFEQALLKRITTVGQANQLLFEYGLIFSDLHETAVKNLVLQNGVFEGLATSIEDAINTAKGKRKGAIQKSLNRLREFAQFEGESGRQKVLSLLQGIESLSAATGQMESHNFVHYARVRNLIQELRRLPADHPAMIAFREYTQFTASLSLAEFLKERVGRLKERSTFWWGWLGHNNLTVGAILGGFIPFMVNGYYYLGGRHTPAHCVPMTVISLVVALGVPVFSTSMVGVTNLKASKVKREIERIEQQRPAPYLFTGVEGNWTPRASFTVDGKRGAYEARPNGSMMQVAAQREGILDFNPVEIAYLGHAEMLELQELYGRLMTDFGREPKRLEEARLAADQVLKDPKNFKSQLQLRTALEGLLGDRPDDQIRADWTLFRAKLEEFKTTMEKIREIPYRIKRDDKNTYSINMAEFLTQRLLKDLNELADEEFNTANLEESLQQLTEHRTELNSILGLIKHYNGDWATAAENTLLLLEKQ